MEKLKTIDKKIISLIQGDIPVTSRPYKKLAEKINISEEYFIERLQYLLDNNILRRFGATLRHQKSGFNANAMVAWSVEDKSQIDRLGDIMSSFSEVTHCYHRNRKEDWKYDLYTMVHAFTKEECFEIVRKISQETKIDKYEVLFSVKELKKTSMKYFNEL